MQHVSILFLRIFCWTKYSLSVLKNVFGCAVFCSFISYCPDCKDFWTWILVEVVSSWSNWWLSVLLAAPWLHGFIIEGTIVLATIPLCSVMEQVMGMITLMVFILWKCASQECRFWHIFYYRLNYLTWFFMKLTNRIIYGCADDDLKIPFHVLNKNTCNLCTIWLLLLEFYF